MKTYPILKLLTDEEIERMLAVEYRILKIDRYTPAFLCSEIDGINCCPLGVALPQIGPSPQSWLIGSHLRSRTDLSFSDAEVMVRDFVNDNDRGKIQPEDLPEIVRLSRALDSES